MAYQILTELFADREIRIVRHPVGRAGHKKEQPIQSDSLGPDELSDTLAPQYGAGGSGPSSSRGSENPLDSTREIVKRSDSALFVSKFTRKAREKLRRAGVACESVDPENRHWVFLTLTYPTESPEGMQAIAENAGWTVKALKNWLQKFKSTTGNYFYVWERQKRGTLHLHYCVHIPDACDRRICLAEFQQWAVSHLHKLAAKSGVNVWVNKWGRDWSENPGSLQAVAQEVQKSVSRYLAKYTSKDAGKNASLTQKYPGPARWWSVSQKLHESVENLTKTVRKRFETFTSAKSWFMVNVSKLIATHPAGVHYQSSLPDCEGESYSMFKVLPCPRLRRFMTNLQKNCVPHFLPNQELSQEVYSGGVNMMIQWRADVRTLTRILHSKKRLSHYLEPLADPMFEGGSEVWKFRAWSKDCREALLDLQSTLSKLSSQFPLSSRLEMSNAMMSLFSLLQSWSKSPQLMESSILFCQEQSSNPSPSEPPVQLTLFQ